MSSTEIVEAAKAEQASAVADPNSTHVSQLVSFRLANEEYGLDIMKVQEIILINEITELPQVPDYVRGLINLRGHVNPVIDLRKRFGLPISEQTEETRIIVVNVEQRTMGLVVDAVHEVLRISPDQVEPPPSGLSGIDQNYIVGLVKFEKKLLILLDIDKLLSVEEQNELGALEQPANV